jgi:uncharacterized protein
MINRLSKEEIVSHFNLLPHPEGGFYRESYRAAGTIPKNALSNEFKGDRNYSTAIYYLLPEGSQSLLHRLHSDEQWHFYLGGPMTLVQISPDGILRKIVLGTDIARGQEVQYVVPANHWFGGFPNPGSRFSFVGCTVAPGFDFADFELGGRKELGDKFPNLHEIIERLGHSG